MHYLSSIGQKADTGLTSNTRYQECWVSSLGFSGCHLDCWQDSLPHPCSAEVPTFLGLSAPSCVMKVSNGASIPCVSFSSRLSCPKHSQGSFPPFKDLHYLTGSPRIIWDYFLRSLTPATSSHVPCDGTVTVLGLRVTGDPFCL